MDIHVQEIDLRSLADAFRTLSVAVEANGERSRTFQQDLESISAKIEQLSQSIDRRFTEVQANIDALSARILSVENHNYTATCDPAELDPLFSLETGQPLVGFPRTVGDIAQLDSDTVNNHLEHLHIVPEGDISARQRQLRIAYGCIIQGIQWPGFDSSDSSDCSDS
ncbi:hypothetical protein GGI43DRAFT_382632 [Trichoderma evansii]